jgi:hypothetical protein
MLAREVKQQTPPPEPLPVVPPEVVDGAPEHVRERLKRSIARSPDVMATDLVNLLAATLAAEAVDHLSTRLTLTPEQRQASGRDLVPRLRKALRPWVHRISQAAATRKGRPPLLSPEREERLYRAEPGLLDLIRESPESVAATIFQRRLSKLLGWAVTLPDPEETVFAATRPGVAPGYRLAALLSVLAGHADDTVSRKLKKYRPGKSPA